MINYRLQRSGKFITSYHPDNITYLSCQLLTQENTIIEAQKRLIRYTNED
ncbi:hypothetical protein WJR50_33020 [Catalinimonas sp. 4WD22]